MLGIFEELLNRYDKEVAVLTLQSDGMIIETSQYFSEILGTSDDNIIGKNITQFDSLLEHDGLSILLDGPYGSYHSNLKFIDEVIPTEVIFFRRADQENTITLFIRNLAHFNEAKHKLAFISKIFQASKEGMVLTDPRGGILYINQSFENITGYSNADVKGQTITILKSGKHDNHFYHKFWQSLVNEGSWQGEIWNKRKNGQIFPEWLNISCLRADDDQITHYIAQFSDINVLKNANQINKIQGYYDPLTCLPNRTLLFEKLAILRQQYLVTSEKFDILFCDVDRFKLINDNYGAHVGDELLKCISTRLAGSLRSNDIFARSGDDEFVIVIKGSAAIKYLNKIILHILSVFDEPFNTPYGHFKMSISIGVSQFPSNSTDIRELISFADVALQQVKKSGGNHYSIFDASQKQLVRQQHSLDQDIKLALQKQELEVWYQPQVNVLTHEVSGVECLLRWNHSTQGIISPTVFIPIVESNGLIIEIGEFVIRTVCKQLQQWTGNQLFQGIIAVNVSLRQLETHDFVQRVKNILLEYQVSGERLEFEVTESLFSENNHHIIDTLFRLRELGIKVSLDDFGTGYSSFQRLKSLPVDSVKIDKCFIDNIDSSEKDIAIVNALIMLSSSFGFGLIAEGIETKQQADCLNSLGCIKHQGFYYSQALRVKDYEDWVIAFNS